MKPAGTSSNTSRSSTAAGDAIPRSATSLRPSTRPGTTPPSPPMPESISSSPILPHPSPASTSFVLAALRALHVDPGSAAGLIGSYEEMREDQKGGNRHHSSSSNPSPHMSTEPGQAHL